MPLFDPVPFDNSPEPNSAIRAMQSKPIAELKALDSYNELHSSLYI